jgi:hypothetical protein
MRDEPGGAGDKKDMDDPEMSSENFYHLQKLNLCSLIFAHSLIAFPKAFSGRKKTPQP